jgi:hypothetical protein
VATDLGEALLDALGGDVSPYSATTPQTAAYGLVGAYGSVSAAARAMEVPRSTFRRWLAGSSPRGEMLDELLDFAREEWRASQDDDLDLGELRVVATFSYAGGKAAKGAEHRDIPLGQYLMPGTADELLDAYRDGASGDELAELLAGNINDPSGWYRDTFDPDNRYGGEWKVERVYGI